MLEDIRMTLKIPKPYSPEMIYFDDKISDLYYNI